MAALHPDDGDGIQVLGNIITSSILNGGFPFIYLSKALGRICVGWAASTSTNFANLYDKVSFSLARQAPLHSE